MSAIISTGALAELLTTSSRVAVLNASWHMPSEQRDAKKEHAKGHIPGAVFFDIDAVSDTSSPYPHMLPDAEAFEKAVSAMGIDNDSDIVVYDSAGLFSAARVWWMFRVFGHKKVRVLDGGLPKWEAENRPLEPGIVKCRPATFKASFHPALVRSFDQMKTNLVTDREQVVDARSAGRFGGTEPEPRPGLRSGHIKGSFNVPFRECTNPPHHTLKPKEELRAVFKSHGVISAKPLVATCGSGVTACVVALALYEIGHKTVAVYDGAWAEWAKRIPA